MKITRLEVSNLLRIKLAQVEPDGALVIVGGNNGQGKSSLLNSIALALSGKELPDRPIHDGASKGHVILQTETLTVTRKFSASGGGSLEVRDADGKAITSPQAKLDTLVSRVTFDPLEFTRMKPDVQAETVRKIVGLDFAALDREAAEVYAERTNVNRQVKAQEGVIQSIQRDGTAPAAEVSIADLTQRLRDAQTQNAANAEERGALSEMNDAIDSLADDVILTKNSIRRLEDELAAKRKLLEQQEQARDAAVQKRDAEKSRILAIQDVDTNSLLSQISEAESVNVRVRANKKWNEEHRKKVELETKADALTARLGEITKLKETGLSKVKFPVDGLGFSDAGVTFNGIPFQQAGSAEQIRTSVAIATALNPELRVMLVRDGSLLDANSFKLLADEAEARQCQIWVEVVGTRDDAAVIIEDGEVASRPAAENKGKKATTKP